MNSLAAPRPGRDATAAARPSFFLRDGEAWLPQEPSRSPWDPNGVNGVAIAGLLMHAAEAVESPGAMLPAHVTIDILRTVPFGATFTRGEVTRPGRKMQMVESRLLAADGQPVARARVLRVREAPSPAAAEPMPHPSPEASRQQPFLQPGFPLAQMFQTLHVAGERETVGPGAVWTRPTCDMAPGLAPTVLVHAAMLSDFGNGVARPVDREGWTFANVDISLHLVRRPVGEWLLVDASAMVQGAGVGLTDMTLYDRTGPFGRAHQTLFIAPAH